MLAILNMSSPGSTLRQKWLAAAAVVAIASSAFCIYYTQSGPSGVNVALNEAVGEKLAQETSRLLGAHGNVVLITVEKRELPELKIQIAAFEKHLKQLGNITVQETVKLDPGDNPKYRAGAGLSAKHFLKIARKHSSADALVSFIGAPSLEDSDMAQIKSMPKFVAETHSPEKLTRLFQKNILQSAIVPRYEFPAPGPRKPHTSHEWFEHCFQIVSSGSGLPTTDAAP